MGLLIRTSDFVGTYEIAQTTHSRLNDYINRFEALYLKQILGTDLYELFEADVTNYEPVTAIYVTIYEPLTVKWNTYEFYSEGLKSILLNLIYWEFMRENPNKATATGLVNQQNEVSNRAWLDMLYKKYNDAVSSIIALQCYINQELEDYSTYNGSKFTYSTIF
jgi:hypothetical protein